MRDRTAERHGRAERRRAARTPHPISRRGGVSLTPPSFAAPRLRLQSGGKLKAIPPRRETGVAQDCVVVDAALHNRSPAEIPCQQGIEQGIFGKTAPNAIFHV
jgi:hypothetical protein